MSIRLTDTPKGLLVRELSPEGETAFRLEPNGRWTRKPSNRASRWIKLRPRDVPQRFRDAVAAFDL